MVDGKVSVFDASRSPEGVARYVAGRLLAGEGYRWKTITLQMQRLLRCGIQTILW
jgi:hypothetical protein